VIAFPQLLVFFELANILPRNIGKFTLSYLEKRYLFCIENEALQRPQIERTESPDPTPVFRYLFFG
jgi:hypothetical protein